MTLEMQYRQSHRDDVNDNVIFSIGPFDRAVEYHLLAPLDQDKHLDQNALYTPKNTTGSIIMPTHPYLIPNRHMDHECQNIILRLSPSPESILFSLELFD